MAAVSYVGAGTESVSATSGANITPVLPSGLQLNDYMVAFCNNTTASAFSSGGMTGWTRLYDSDANATAPHGAAYAKYASSTDVTNAGTGTYTVNNPGGIALGRIFAWRNVNLTTAMDVAAAPGPGSSASVTAYAISSQTPVSAGGPASVTHVWSNATTGSFTPPASHTEVWDSNGGGTANVVEAAYRLNVSGAQSRTATRSAGTKGGWAGLILRPSTTTVVATVATTWNTKTSVAPTSATTTWNTKAAIVPSCATTWRVMVTVTPSLATTWNVYVPVAAITQSTTWRALGTVTPVTSTTTWDSLATVITIGRSPIWRSLLPVINPNSTTWRVLQVVGDTQLTTWDARSAVAVALSTTWKTKAKITSTRSTTWDVGSPDPAPTANAGTDQTGVASYTAVTLNGSGSSSGVTYSWKQTHGVRVKAVSMSSSSPRFVAPTTETGTVLVFQLTVTDNVNRTDVDTVSVTVTAYAPYAMTRAKTPILHS